MSLSPEIQAKVQLWRQKCREGTMTLDEYKEAIQFLRANRTVASQTSDKARAKRVAAKAAPVSGEDLLGELEGL